MTHISHFKSFKWQTDSNFPETIRTLLRENSLEGRERYPINLPLYALKEEKKKKKKTRKARSNFWGKDSHESRWIQNRVEEGEERYGFEAVCSLEGRFYPLV